ncbi:MAG: hypothetical protein J6M53_01005 [Bacteroidaceae bacterium]|nr:hypothetical protein [Bacteroidaceae bacterium]
MKTTVFTPVQLQLLRLFSTIHTEEEEREVQILLTNYYKEKVQRRASEVWRKLDLNQTKLEEMCSIHERLPYR